MFFSGSNKKAKSFDFDNTKLSKAPLFALTPANTPAKRTNVPQIAGQKRKGEDETITTSSKRQEPSSAPAPAGRSPTKQKHKGLMSRRRFTASPFTRVDPPSSAPAAGLPFSIDAAIAGTLPGLKPKSKSKTSTKGWQFEIHEDSPDDEMANLMEHSTCTLDISDDEGRCSPKGDRDNKENIPPVNYEAGGNTPASRRDMMTDEVRSPLGDLDAQKYYAEGCDASSIIVVPAEEADKEDQVVVQDDSPTRGPLEMNDDNQQVWKDLLAEATAKPQVDDDLVKTDVEGPEIQIWESESAKAEEEATALDDLVGSEAAPDSATV